MAQVLNGSNAAGDDAIKSYVARIEELDRQKMLRHMEYMKECAVIAGDKKEVLKEAHESGLSKKALRAKVKERDLLRKAADVPKDLEDDEAADFAKISKALGPFADTPLGQAATGRKRDRGQTASEADQHESGTKNSFQDAKTAAMVGAVRADMSDEEWEAAGTPR